MQPKVSKLLNSAYEVEWVSKVKVILWPWPKVTQISKLKLVFSKTIGRFGTRVHMKAWGKMRMKLYINELSHITNMASLPIYGKNLKKSSPEPLDWKCLCLACLLRWAIQGLRALLFRNYCSLGSQSCLKHSTKWVNEVEWVSKVKIILWPWSKDTQISKLKLVFLKSRWAIFELKFIWKLEGE